MMDSVISEISSDAVFVVGLLFIDLGPEYDAKGGAVGELPFELASYDKSFFNSLGVGVNPCEFDEGDAPTIK
jgi:hypothetical protein